MTDDNFDPLAEANRRVREEMKACLAQDNGYSFFDKKEEAEQTDMQKFVAFFEKMRVPFDVTLKDRDHSIGLAGVHFKFDLKTDEFLGIEDEEFLNFYLRTESKVC